MNKMAEGRVDVNGIFVPQTHQNTPSDTEVVPCTEYVDRALTGWKEYIKPQISGGIALGGKTGVVSDWTCP